MRLIKLLVVALLFSNTLHATDTLAVAIHMNGYKGNLSWKTGDGEKARYFYFYVKNTSGDTIVKVPPDNSGNYMLDNGAYEANSSFGIKVENGRFILVNDSADITMNVLKGRDGLDSMPVITLHAFKIDICKSGLTLPYMLSAFALIPGQSTTEGSRYRFIAHDTSVMLINGMNYTIDNGGFAAGCGYSTAFSFVVSRTGAVVYGRPSIAKVSGNKLTFTTDAAQLDPASVTGLAGVPLVFRKGTDGKLIVTKAEKIKCFRTLANTFSWTANARAYESLFILP